MSRQWGDPLYKCPRNFSMCAKRKWSLSSEVGGKSTDRELLQKAVFALLIMKILTKGVAITMGVCALQISGTAADVDQATPATSGPVRPLKTTTEGADPSIVAGERKAQFDRLDADKNSLLNQEEFARITALARRIGSGIGTAGVNTPETEGNSLIPTGDLSKLFKDLDGNQDGTLTLAEFLHVPLSKSEDSMATMKSEVANTSRSTGATVGKPSLGNLDRSALFHRLDKDKSGSLEAGEFGKMNTTELPSRDHAGAFQKLDLDTNGKLSREEFQKLPPGPSTPPAVIPPTGNR